MKLDYFMVLSGEMATATPSLFRATFSNDVLPVQQAPANKAIEQELPCPDLYAKYVGS